MKCIVFTGGGTAGHIFPGLAVAELVSQDYNIVWLGSKNIRDASFVSTLPRVNFISIPSGKYRRYFSFRNVIDVFKIIYAFFVSFFILLRLKPLLLFSKGGFVSTPPCIAAYLLRIPVITHECDFSPGLATRLNAKFAKKILISYPETARFFKEEMSKKILYTGNPVRSFFYNANGQKTFSFIGCLPEKPILLILGGSLGAEQINTLIYENIKELIKYFFVIHQTGEAHIEKAKSVLQELKDLDYQCATNYAPYSFIKEELPDIIFSSHIVVSRSGSNTVWELATLGKPMVLIPLEKGSSRGDQVENALFFSEKKAAITLRNVDATNENFLNVLLGLNKDKAMCSSLSLNAKNLANKDIAKNIVNIIEDLISN